MVRHPKTRKKRCGGFDEVAVEKIGDMPDNTVNGEPMVLGGSVTEVNSTNSENSSNIDGTHAHFDRMREFNTEGKPVEPVA